MTPTFPEKARLLMRLREEGFNVPRFIYVSSEDFSRQNFDALKTFFREGPDEYKVIARSAHPQEHLFKGGTFDSLETYADVEGIVYARKRIIQQARTAKRLSIARQRKFNDAPEPDLESMGILVMPFVEGTCVMAKVVGDHWEFGYAREANVKVRSDPFITRTPHDRRLIGLSEQIQDSLGFRCEIEYLVSEDGIIHVVQAKDISHIELPDQMDQEMIRLDGIRRYRRNRNYRERPFFVMDNRAFCLNIIGHCEEIVFEDADPQRKLTDILAYIADYEARLETFALRHQRFGVLGLRIRVPEELQQIVNHYLDDIPEVQSRISQALRANQYKIDYFLSEADTLVAKNRLRVNICTHDAYGVETVRNPLWFCYWMAGRHDAMVRRLRKAGFKTGDTIAIEIDAKEKPALRRL